MKRVDTCKDCGLSEDLDEARIKHGLKLFKYASMSFQDVAVKCSTFAEDADI